MADKITKESNETASLLISKSEETAKDTVANAKAESDKIISSAREYSTNLIAEKTQQAEEITNKAQDKANEVIASAKVVAQDILDQAKQISDDLIAKSKAEKEAYEILSNTIKNDAKEFIEKVKSLYNNELDALNSAKLDKENDDTESEEKSIAEIDSEVSGLVDEIEEFTSSIPQPISSEESDDDTEDAEAEEAEDLQEVIAPDDAEDSEEEIEYEREEDNKEPAFDLNEIEYEEITDDDDEDDITEDDEKPVIEEDDEPADPMEAVEAFSQNQITPIKSDSPIPEISEDADMEDDDDLFDNSGELPFEAYFNVNQQDVHNDKSQTISLIPPEGDEDDEPQPKFKGIFKKKK